MVAPAPQFPERAPGTYERKMAPAVPGNRGPLRFEEGLATDTAIPDDFQQGMMEGSMPGPHGQVNPDSQYKHADQVLKERVHPGSASWTDSSLYLSGFASGAGEGQRVETSQVMRDGGRHEDVNAAVVND